ncbi:hypothetical protein BSL78_21482 [Apostichopus japonicus]|uniref:Tyr recombinase domain-containing protein n=1 Tax=Stichopus japonicus TaxID=307972 RepID=A0A2G8K0Z0_STIJA|nr:hypothetical protein BSL78_21482 [Apostichopus japonicus]
MTCRNIVSEKMRRIAGLLLEAKKICPNVESAKDLIDPSNFTKVVQAVRVCSGFNASTQAFASPSLANKLGQSLAVLAELVISDAIETGNTEYEYKAEQFLKLKSFKWKKNISSKVYKQQCKQTWEKPKKIPLTADTVKLNQLILNKTKETKQKIESDGVTTSLWRELASLTLSNVITFNRRRPGETQFLNLDWYQTHITKADEFHDEIYQSLPLPQKLALKRLTLIMTRGKKGRGVPIMLTEDMVESLTILNENREAAGVSGENPYVFACPSDESVQPLRGHQCLKQHAKQCGAKHPSRLTATNLRKHLATVSQILNLSSSELEQLANHLGHDVNVHRQYYRLPQDIIFPGQNQ